MGNKEKLINGEAATKHNMSEEEIVEARSWLKDKGLIDGMAAWGGEIIRASITNRAIELYDRETSLRAKFGPQKPQNPVTFQNTINQQGTMVLNQGENQKFSINVGFGPEEVLRLATALRAAGQDELATEVEEAKGDNSKLRATLGRILEWLGEVATGAVTQQVTPENIASVAHAAMGTLSTVGLN